MRMIMNLDATGFEEARRTLQAMKLRAGNVMPAWEELLHWWAEENLKHFETRGARWLTPWKPLAASTVREKIRLGFPTDPLIRTGKMAEQLTNRPLGFERISPFEVTAGTRLRRAFFHQVGTRYMPQRRLVNAAQVKREQAATSVLRTWIIQGDPRVDATEVLRP
jgi:hypothetical protein